MSLKVLVIGAGGVGGYFGGRLAAAGNDVTFVARGRHLVAMQSNGLTLLSPLGDVRLPNVRPSWIESFVYDITLTTSVLRFSIVGAMTERLRELFSYPLMKPSVIALAMLVNLPHFEGLGTVEIISQKSRKE